MFLDPDKPIGKHRFGLPHWHQDDTLVFVTSRLADSLPQSVISHITRTRETFLKNHPKPDDCHGSCCLWQHHTIVSNALHHFDNERYQLDTFVVMPNHVHVLLKLKADHPLETIIHSLKRHTAREINKELKQTGKLWQSK
jgi:type I restriction enzyme R subunit